MSSTNLSVIVSSPDERHRATIIVPLNSTIKQLTRLSCQKHWIPEDQVDQYRLRHGRSLIDDRLPVRLSGLASGAKLVLVLISAANTSRTPTMVTVALQYVGQHWQVKERWVYPFSVASSLWQILQRFHQEHPECLLLLPIQEGCVLVPHLVILNQEYFGPEQLIQTTLESIGINKGNCVIRVSHRSLNSSLIQIQEYLERYQTNLPQITQYGSRNDQVVHDPSYITSSPIDDNMSVPRGPPELLESSTITLPAEENLSFGNIILYRPPLSTFNPSTNRPPHPPDEFYETKEMDVRLHYSSLKAQTTQLMDAPLVSRARLLEKRRREMLGRHPFTIIRFRLPDQHQVQATFCSTKPARVLFDFIQSIFRKEKTPQGLTLIRGPPSQKLTSSDEQIPLWQLDLIPNALINVAWDDGIRSSEQYLKEEILATITDYPSPTLETMITEPSTQSVDQTRPEEGQRRLDDQQSTSANQNTTRPVNMMKKPSWLRL